LIGTPPSTAVNSNAASLIEALLLSSLERSGRNVRQKTSRAKLFFGTFGAAGLFRLPHPFLRAELFD
ncbi:MAG: hypothetical protein ACK5SF_14915, partial [Hyphomonadaceae bacterium]